MEGHDGVGMYWSYAEDTAECYWGNKKHNIVLTGLVRPSRIEYTRTAIVNTAPTGGTENEIALFEGAAIELVKITEDGKTIWEGKKKIEASRR